MMNAASFNKRPLVTNGIASINRIFCYSKYIAALFLVVIFAHAAVLAPAWATDLPDSLQTKIAAAFDRVDKLLEELEYDEAARILEEMLVEDIPLEAKIEINTKLAFVYEQNRLEQKAIDCLLENLRNFPSYGLPDSLQVHLQRLYAKALEAYQKERRELNRPPKFVDPPVSLEIKPGERLRFLIKAIDADNDTLKLSLGSESHGVLKDYGNGSGLVTYEVPEYLDSIATSLHVVVNDGLAGDTAVIALAVVLEEVKGPPSIVGRSMLVPGRGQYTSGRRGVGAALFVAQVVSLGASAAFTLSYNNAVDDYNVAYGKWLTAYGAQLTTSLIEIRDKYRTVSSKEKSRNIAYVATVLVYAVNIVDAILARPNSPPPDAQENAEHNGGRQTQFCISPDGIFFSVKW